jgi:hypothetical protein
MLGGVVREEHGKESLDVEFMRSVIPVKLVPPRCECLPVSPD